MKLPILLSVLLFSLCGIAAHAQINTYHYFPDSCVVSGTIIKEQYYPYCGFGLFPEEDTIVNYYFIKLHHKIKVIGNPTLDEEITGLTESNVNQIQLLDSTTAIEWEEYLDEEVQLIGYFGHATDTEHHSNVIITVFSVIDD
jgi:hypothetical protein